ncbi:MAG: hypothetical protein ACRCSV_03835 [Chlamydiales bacterium]
MEIKTPVSFLSKPINTYSTNEEISIVKSSPAFLHANSENYDLSAPAKCSKPNLVHPSDLQEIEKPNLSMKELLIDAFDRSQKMQESQIKYLYEKQEKLTEALLEAKKKMVDLNKSSDSTLNFLKPTITDIALPLCISIIALYLGFSFEDPLSKISAICTSIIGFSIAGLKMIGTEIPKYMPSGFIAIFNLYIIFMNPTSIFSYITTFLQTVPVITNSFYTIHNNSICSDQVLAKKAIKNIDAELKKVSTDISRAIKMISAKGKFFSMTTDYTQLQNKIATAGPV